MDVLADSGILLRLLETTDPLHTITDRAVRVLHARGDRIAIAPQNVAEFWNVCPGHGEGWLRPERRGNGPAPHGHRSPLRRPVRAARRLPLLAVAGADARLTREAGSRRSACCTAKPAEDWLGCSYGTANKPIGQFQTAGLLREMTGFGRNRRYAYDPYLALLPSSTRPHADGPPNQTTASNRPADPPA